jgi:hypothetical protein
MRSRLLSRLIDGEGADESETLAYIGGALLGVVLANLVLAIAFGVSYMN